MSESASPGKQQLPVKVVAVAMAASIPMYVLVAFLVVRNIGGEPAANAGTMALLLVLAGIMAAATGFFLRRRLAAAPGASVPLATLLSFALFEASTILGLVAAILARQPFWCVAGAAVSLVLMAACWPRDDA